MIDKLSDYVSRNGDKFEECIRAKSDERFSFLEPGNPNHSYYKFKLNNFKVFSISTTIK